MNFFIPQADVKDYEQTYGAIVKTVKEQMRIPITGRRIYSLDYVKDGKNLHFEVGQLEPQGRYEVLVILESKPHVVFTREINGSHGVTILVSNDDITNVEYFE